MHELLKKFFPEEKSKYLCSSELINRQTHFILIYTGKHCKKNLINKLFLVLNDLEKIG